MFRRSHVVACLLAAWAILPNPTQAAWPPEGTLLHQGAHGYRGAWIDDDDQGGQVIRLVAFGNAVQWGEFARVQSNGDMDAAWEPVWQGEPGAADPDGQGGYFILSRSGPGSGGSYPCVIHHVLAGGIADPAWPATGAPVSDFVHDPSFDLVRPRMVPDGDGGVYVAYEYFKPTPPTASGVYVQHFGRFGLSGGWPGAGLRLGGGSVMGLEQAMVADGAGGVYVLATSFTSNLVITAHHLRAPDGFDPNWTRTGIELASIPWTDEPVRLIGHGSSASALWRTTMAGVQHLNVLRLDAKLDQGEWWAASAPLGTGVGAVETFDDGVFGLYAIWQQNAPATDVRGLRWSGAGALVTGWDDPGVSRLPGAAVLNAFDRIAAGRDGADGVVLAWKDQRGGRDSLYATRLLGNGTRHGSWAADGNLVPIQAALHPTAPAAKGHPLAARGDAAGYACVAWHVGDINYDETRLARLAVAPPAGVGAPGPPGLGAPHVVPNPAQGRLHVSFALPGDAPATLEMLDLSGRRVRARSIAGGAGERRVEWTLGADVPPGLYFLRLVHQGIAVTRRFSVVR